MPADAERIFAIIDETKEIDERNVKLVTAFETKKIRMNKFLKRLHALENGVEKL